MITNLVKNIFSLGGDHALKFPAIRVNTLHTHTRIYAHYIDATYHMVQKCCIVGLKAIREVSFNLHILQRKRAPDI